MNDIALAFLQSKKVFLLGIADSKVFYSEGWYINNMIAFAEKNDWMIGVGKGQVSCAKGSVVDSQTYRITF